MALDGLTLGFIARELNDTLLGGRIDKVQQPEKDMALIHIRAGGENHRLLVNASPTGTRLHLTENAYESPMEAPVFCMLMRKHLVSGRVMGVTQMGGDRLLRMDIAVNDEMGEKRDKQLYFEAMGRHTNLSLVENGRIIDSLRHVTDEMSRVRRMLPGAPFELPPAQDKLTPGKAEADALYLRLAGEGGRLDKALANTLSGIAGASAREICLRLTGNEQPQTGDINLRLFCGALAEFLRALPGMAQPMLYLDEQGLPKEALPFPFLSLPRERQQPQESLSRALDTLYYQRDRHERLQQRSGAFRRTLKSAEERVLKKLSLQEEELQGAARMDEYRVAGELLTAYAHMVPKGANEVELPNYYDNEPLKVSLDPSLSPAANAQKYFKRYRKANVARKTAALQKENTLRELALVEDALWAVQSAQTMQDIAEIKQPLSDAGLMKRDPQPKNRRREKESEPLRYRSAGGLSILVGKNSLQNERLLKLSQGDDLWLHAKDMPGSHVILQAPGQSVPEEALLLAGKLAAFYSKGAGQGVPVNYTWRRYVKKPAGSAPGYVTFTGEKLLILSADEDELRPYLEESK